LEDTHYLMEQKILKTILTYGLWNLHDRIIAAVSGGPDSIAMTAVFCRLMVNPGQVIHVAHFDHASRPDSGKDADFVMEFCEKMNLPFSCARLKNTKPRGESWEVFWRRERYIFLDAVKDRHQARFIATAHTQDDQLETILMRIANGTGPRGLCGIRIKTASGIIRPLLFCSRKMILEYLTTTETPFRLDPSNLDMKHPRNYIRQNIVPYFTALNPNIFQTVQSMCELVADEDDWITSHTDSILKNLKWDGTLPFALKLEYFNAFTPAVLRRVAIEILHRINRDLDCRYTRDHVFQFCDFLLGGIRAMDLPMGIICRRQGSHLFVFKKPKSFSLPGKLVIPLPGSIRFGNYILQTEISCLPQTFPPPDQCLYLNPSCGPLWFRYRQPGDRFQPFGMKSPVRLKKYLNTRHIPLELRNSLPLIVNGENEIIAIPGHSVSEIAAIDKEMERAIKITWKHD
jgi:tRNA(Ile)-lysidine synthase